MSHIDPPPARTPSGPAPHRHDPGGRDNLDVVHETSDINVRAVIGFAVALFVVTAAVSVLMYGLFWYFDRKAAENDPPVSPLARPSVEMPRSSASDPYFGQGQGPRLLTHEPSVLAKQRKMEQDVLESYGWVDEKSGVARMPISEAKKLTLQRGLPARADEVDPSLGTRRATFGESSSGRTIPVGRKKEEVPTQEVTKEEAAPAPAAPHKKHEK